MQTRPADCSLSITLTDREKAEFSPSVVVNRLKGLLEILVKVKVLLVISKALQFGDMCCATVEMCQPVENVP